MLDHSLTFFLKNGCGLDVRQKWVSVSSTGKVFNGWIRNLDLVSTYTKNWLIF